MSAHAFMVMGTGSDVGKSLIVAGLCRAFANRGITVAPFKPQNMSNNAAVTADGGEIGRAQALQAQAARRQPVTAMNPVLLKPEAETGAQVVVRGQRRASMRARDYFKTREELLPEVLGAFQSLRADTDLILVEGAGSASEINLRAGDIANFGFASAARVPVLLVGDIHRGGVIAQIVGTFAVIAPDDAALIAASLVNKFHGDPTLFDAGRADIAARTGVPCMGPVPDFPLARRLPAEDSMALDFQPQARGEAIIAVPRLPRIANFDDLDPLAREPGVRLVMVEPGHPLPRDAKLVVLPGSKATMADLAFFKQQGWDIDLAAHIRAGGHVLGLCGGYQMLGTTLSDPEGIEGARETMAGLGHLDVQTRLGPKKELRVEAARSANGDHPLSGYHMHMGRTEGADRARPFAWMGSQSDGASDARGRVQGTYLHAIFANDAFRRAFLERLAIATDPELDFRADVDATLDHLAAHLEAHLDLDHLLTLTGPGT